MNICWRRLVLIALALSSCVASHLAAQTTVVQNPNGGPRRSPSRATAVATRSSSRRAFPAVLHRRVVRLRVPSGVWCSAAAWVWLPTAPCPCHREISRRRLRPAPLESGDASWRRIQGVRSAAPSFDWPLPLFANPAPPAQIRTDRSSSRSFRPHSTTCPRARAATSRWDTGRRGRTDRSGGSSSPNARSRNDRHRTAARRRHHGPGRGRIRRAGLRRVRRGTAAAGHVNNARRPIPVGSPSSSNDIGEFRIYGLSPGDYYVAATPRTLGNPLKCQTIWTGGRARPHYPSTPEVSAAQRVHVSSGDTVTNIVVALTPTRTARISGTVLDGAGRPARGGNVMVASRNGGPGLPSANGFVRQDGSFTVTGLAPGDYTLRAFINNPQAGGMQRPAAFDGERNRQRDGPRRRHS